MPRATSTSGWGRLCAQRCTNLAITSLTHTCASAVKYRVTLALSDAVSPSQTPELNALLLHQDGKKAGLHDLLQRV
jgi:hypothetical protein